VHPAPPLRSAQKEAVKIALKVLAKSGGTTVVLPCGAGKSYVGAGVSKILAVRTAVLAHQTNLLAQWKDAFEKICGPSVKIGTVRGSVNHDGDVVLVSTPTLVSRGAQCIPPVSLVIIDECHHAPAEATRMALSQLECKYVLGLTATPDRADKHPPEWYCGPRAPLHVTTTFGRVPEEAEESLFPSTVTVERVPLKVHQICTKVGTTNDIVDRSGNAMLPKMLNYLMLSERRFKMVRDLLEEWSRKHHVIVLSDRKQVLKHLHECFPGSRLCTGDEGAQGQREALADRPRILLATTGVAREGLDAPWLDCVLLLTPSVRIEQCVGRVQRVGGGKTEAFVLDLIDLYPTYQHWARARKRRYEALGACVQFHMGAPPSPN